MKIKIYWYLSMFVLSSSVHATEVSKDDWIAGMNNVLPTVFCKSEQYFRQCFSVTAEECEEVAVSATRVCLNNNKDEIPDVLVQPEDGTHWGTVIGACAGEAYEASLMKKRINKDVCNDAANWQ